MNSAPSPRISLHCPTCQKRLAAPSHFVGKSVKCPHCSAPLIVPAPQSPTIAPVNLLLQEWEPLSAQPNPTPPQPVNFPLASEDLQPAPLSNTAVHGPAPPTDAASDWRAGNANEYMKRAHAEFDERRERDIEYAIHGTGDPDDDSSPGIVRGVISMVSGLGLCMLALAVGKAAGVVFWIQVGFAFFGGILAVIEGLSVIRNLQKR